MKNPTPVIVARIASLAVSIIVLIILIFIRIFFPDELSWLFVLLIPLIVFIAGYFIISYSIEYFIYRKIKLIYKTIYETKSSQKSKPGKLRLKDDIIEDTAQEVLTWKEDKEMEQHKMRNMEIFRKEFLGNVFHELKTPVFNIQGYLDTLLEGGLKDEKINKKFLKRANKNVKRIANIVSDLQLIANLEDGSFSLQEEKFNICKLAEEVMESLEIRAEKNKIKLAYKEGCKKSFYVSADREMIQQVMTNLITNSIKYGNEEGKTLIGLYDMNKVILVEVTDSGIGIEKEHLPRIFERFYRVDKNRSREQGGSGLGLSIVKHIVESHGQAINVRSTPGVGSTFGFTLKKAQYTK